MEALRFYFRLVGLSMQARMQYRADFIMGILSVITLNAVNLGLIGIIVYRSRCGGRRNGQTRLDGRRFGGGCGKASCQKKGDKQKAGQSLSDFHKVRHYPPEPE